MATRFYFEGLDEFRNALRRMPEGLAGQAADIIEGQTNGAETEIRSVYAAHRHTGYLASHLRKTVTRQRVAAVGVLKNTSPHAWWFENGTIVRHTDKGANRGSMEPVRAFIPVMRRRRREMFRLLKEALRNEGLLVEGDA